MKRSKFEVAGEKCAKTRMMDSSILASADQSGILKTDRAIERAEIVLGMPTNRR